MARTSHVPSTRKAAPGVPRPPHYPYNRLTAARRLRSPAAQALALLAFGPGVYKREGPGALYFQFRVARPYLRSSLAHNLPPRVLQTRAFLDLKIGHTADLRARLAQYAKCQENGHQIWFWAYCLVPYRMLAERLIHLIFMHMGARLRPYSCPGCRVHHREFFSLRALGGLGRAEAIVKLVVQTLGGQYERLMFGC
ncbi:hypothetical protein B0H15DRAFT_1020302 [Mycena belliarum]|uniref:Bacteriophage T5 Orf172 DNA-binding domain-containing protein n=1 Tax=Mycena belliarum TaxID=1033014 RepID=A0AAD6UE88_9AGAR|nr:hypothetical protein B0H15DRAFT_1020302 [Mycena belliae]